MNLLLGRGFTWKIKPYKLYSSKDKSKILKCCLLQILFGALRVNHRQDKKITLSTPRMCILAIISAVKRKVTIKSRQNVMYSRAGCSWNVFGVFMLTDIRLTNAQPLRSQRTHSLLIHSMSALSLRFSSGP